MASNSNFPPFNLALGNQFPVYATLIFSYTKKPGRSQLASDFEAGQKFFNEYLGEQNRNQAEEDKKNNLPHVPRELVFFSEGFEVDGKLYYRLTAVLKPRLVSKPRKAKATKKLKTTAEDSSVQPQAVAMNFTGGPGSATPPDPKGPPPSSTGITNADEEQNY